MGDSCGVLGRVRKIKTAATENTSSASDEKIHHNPLNDAFRETSVHLCENGCFRVSVELEIRPGTKAAKELSKFMQAAGVFGAAYTPF